MVVLLGALAGGASELFSGRRALLQQGDELAEPDQGFSATKK
jgi:hypothetical protein